ncbi:hypothetical protein BDV29DRAFT_92992 [Aspergillus leporis]|uniref:Uncharacterized protein n=1 Tax=Aspergillus leporis TaxID=41062 RepID=A0A5N5X5X7_9EURO|nr:hypothetical protein BDV29DRAFT_92992 [Aspergillus leporis]
MDIPFRLVCATFCAHLGFISCPCSFNCGDEFKRHKHGKVKKESQRSQNKNQNRIRATKLVGVVITKEV